jgi:Initiator Rep protein, WH2/Initiator Replication protein, WH1
MLCMALTVAQRKNGEGFPKAGELIEFRPQRELTLQDRRILNLLIEHAGPQIASEQKHRIPMATLRGAHKGGERVRDSIVRLMTTIVEVPGRDGQGSRATQRGVFLSDTTTTDNEDNPLGEVVYSFSETMRQVIARSQYWGRLKAYIICSFQSKYALALYEALCLRANLQISEQELSVKDFRDLLGLPADKLMPFKNLKNWAIDPAVAEVNALSDFWVEVEAIREGSQRRGQLKGFRLLWRRKEKGEWQACLDELMRPKVGRKARIKGQVESVSA